MRIAAKKHNVIVETEDDQAGGELTQEGRAHKKISGKFRQWGGGGGGQRWLIFRPRNSSSGGGLLHLRPSEPGLSA